jgi:hypothetical protein
VPLIAGIWGGRGKVFGASNVPVFRREMRYPLEIRACRPAWPGLVVRLVRSLLGKVDTVRPLSAEAVGLISGRSNPLELPVTPNPLTAKRPTKCGRCGLNLVDEGYTITVHSADLEDGIDSPPYCSTACLAHAAVTLMEGEMANAASRHRIEMEAKHPPKKSRAKNAASKSKA